MAPQTGLELTQESILGTQDVEEVRYEDPIEAARAIVQRILEAPDADAVLEQANVIHARDVLGKPLRVIASRFQRSRFAGDGGNPTLFALLECINETGDDVLVSCGGRNVLAQLYRLHELDAFPVDVRIVEGSETSQGYKPLWLERV